MIVRRFSGGAMAARCARLAVREELGEALPRRQLADVELLVSELATNSVRHAGCGETDEISIRADVKPDRVRVSMFDLGDGFDVHTPEPPSTGAAGGYGLVLLERLSDRWGVQRGDGFGVWFEVQRERLPFGDERRPRAQTA
jgi:anti-sigma regulatory factor (Ser/Thr protein kinase)